MEKGMFFNELMNIYNGALNNLNTILKTNGSVQFTYDKVFDGLFYSDCNGVIPYNIAKVTENGDLLCTEEGQKWTKKTVIDEEETSGITLCATMIVEEMDKGCFCCLVDYINDYLNIGKTNYGKKYLEIYQETCRFMSKLTFPINVADMDFEDVVFVNEDNELDTTIPTIFFDTYLLDEYDEQIEYDRIPNDDFVNMVDNIINSGVL